MKKLLFTLTLLTVVSAQALTPKDKKLFEAVYSDLRKARRNILVDFIVSNEPEHFKTALSRGYRRRAFMRNTDELLSSLLILAYGLENDTIVAILLEYGARIIDTNVTALHVASREGSSNAITALIKKGAPINATTNKGLTALHLAAQKGHLRVVELLLEHNADTNATTDDGETPLSLAQENGHTEIIKLLEEHKPNN